MALLQAQVHAEGLKAITPAKGAKLGRAILQALNQGDPAFRRAYLRLFVGRVTVEDEVIRITGRPRLWRRQRGQTTRAPFWRPVPTFIRYGVP